MIKEIMIIREHNYYQVYDSYENAIKMIVSGLWSSKRWCLGENISRQDIGNPICIMEVWYTGKMITYSNPMDFDKFISDLNAHLLERKERILGTKKSKSLSKDDRLDDPEYTAWSELGYTTSTY
jgi:hypothetical protein